MNHFTKVSEMKLGFEEHAIVCIWEMPFRCLNNINTARVEGIERV
jgi:hypothetical protein